MVIYQALLGYDGHPTADDIIGYIKQSYPGISSGTVYKTLETFVHGNLIRRVKQIMILCEIT
jgi:Fur family peroxide stress response transcriptional regulator